MSRSRTVRKARRAHHLAVLKIRREESLRELPRIESERNTHETSRNRKEEK